MKPGDVFLAGCSGDGMLTLWRDHLMSPGNEGAAVRIGSLVIVITTKRVKDRVNGGSFTNALVLCQGSLGWLPDIYLQDT